MRVIAGSARSIPLVTPEGLKTRPTTDKIKETLFNILQFDIADCVFIDIFAGSGALGIVALSRGAAHAFFIDSGREADGCIRQNLKKCRLEQAADVYRMDALRGIDKLKLKLDADHRRIIMMDPPYDKGLEFPVLKKLIDDGIAEEDSIIIVETSLKGDITEALSYGYELQKEKIYKNQKHFFLKKI